MDAQIEAPASTPAPVVEHDRQVTATAGMVKLGRWNYPARVYEGVAQYQTREGDWVDVPGEDFVEDEDLEVTNTP